VARRSTHKRPFGVTAVVVLQSVSVLMPAVDVCGVQAGQPSFFLPGVEDPRFVLSVDLAIILVELVIAFGLWRLKRWAWVLIVIQRGVSMAIN